MNIKLWLKKREVIQMRRLFLVGAITSLLATTASVAWPSKNLNSSRSNIYRMQSSSSAVPPAKATAILEALEKSNPNGNATVETLKRILQQQGINAGNLVIKIDATKKPPMVYILIPEEAAQAGLAVSPGANQPSLLPPLKGTSGNQQGLPPPGPGAK